MSTLYETIKTMQQKIILTLITFLTVLPAFAQVDLDLENGFQNPPPSAKARTWWHWMNGNISKSGITADLEAMKRVGIQEAQIFNVGHNPQGAVPYMSPEWLDLFHFAASEASRLGLELGFHNGAGWSSSGGPWMKPENAMQMLVYSELSPKGGQLFKAYLPQPETRLEYYQDIAVLAFPKPKMDLKIDNLDYKNLSGRVRNHLNPDTKSIPEAAIVPKSTIIDLSSKLSVDGFLEWNVPKGEWIILRLGHTPIGTKNHPAPGGGHGLECDKMSKQAVDAYWKGGVQPILTKLDTLIGSVVKNCLIDSYEVGSANWTAGFDKAFKKRRNYDCLNFLPALAGYYVDSGPITERFLWDFRRTVGDLMAENYYTHFRDLCHQNDLKLSVEPYWGPFNSMQVGAAGDIVMSEFWSGNLAFFDSPKFVASIAKLNGSAIVGAESFTAAGGWTQHPASLKSIGDKAWAQGINRFIFHTFVHQPWEVEPGLTLGPWGIDFNRKNTWWEQSKGFLDYIARSQFLLQQGQSVADVLVFTGESSPNNALLMPEIKAMGYDYDLIGANKLKTLSVSNGQVKTEHGANYQMLVLPESNWMTMPVLKKIEQLANAGATIIGVKPHQSPSLQAYPNQEGQLAQLADQLWGAGLVKEETVVKLLKEGTLPPAFSTLDEAVRTDMDFLHRKTRDADVFFIANARKEAGEVLCRFRMTGKQPELWNPETGEIKDLIVWQDNGDGTMSIPIPFDPEGAVFVVFRKKIIDNKQLLELAMDVEQPVAKLLPDLKIIKAVYGTFLPDGLVDVTDIVAGRIKDNQLSVPANRSMCACDPAPGYKKELRVEYKIGDAVYSSYAREKERLIIDPRGKGDLKILKAVFGKFERGKKGVPDDYPIYEVTEKINELLETNKVTIPVGDHLVEGLASSPEKKVLRIVYSSNGIVQERSILEGKMLKLGAPVIGPGLVYKDGDVYWRTPYPGTLDYKEASGRQKSILVEDVPAEITLEGPWELDFPIKKEADKRMKWDTLGSWSNALDEEVKYFSGTASYKKQFFLSDELLEPSVTLDLDLGSVQVIAEVILNGKNRGILWKAPFTINLDGFVKAGQNDLEIKVTNLWPNRLIGDEQYPKDFELNGQRIKSWPAWLLTQTKRPSGRQTFAGHQHWQKDAALQTSGLLGPVLIRPSILKKIGLK